MTEPTVRYEERGAVALLTLNRPEALNSFTRAMHRDLWAALDRAEHLRDDADALAALWPQARVIVLDDKGNALADGDHAPLMPSGAEITEASLSKAMALSHVPDPDLLIRTGGEMRISNFLLWQSAYTEMVFTPCLWPDFDAQALDQALADYASRERRFGLTSEQVASVSRSSHA